MGCFALKFPFKGGGTVYKSPGIIHEGSSEIHSDGDTRLKDECGTMVIDSEIDTTGDTEMREGDIRDDELNNNEMITPSVEENQQQKVGTEAVNMNVMNVDLKGEDEEKMNVMIVCGE